MQELINFLNNQEFVFIRNALIAGILASVSFGIMGTYVVTRRISYIAGAISHCVLAGIGLALYTQSLNILPWFTTDIGLIISGILSALIIGAVSIWWKQREDTVIGAIWAIGMSLGLFFYYISENAIIDPNSYLFGNINLVDTTSLWFIGGLDILLLILIPLFYRKFQAICFDEEFCKTRGINTDFYYLLLLCLISLAIVLFIKVVGMIMIIALLTLPAAAANQFAHKLWQMMIWAGIFCGLSTTSGTIIGYNMDINASPIIIIVAGAIYLLSLLIKTLFKKIKTTA